MHLLRVAVIGLIIGCAIAEESANKLSEDSFGNGDIKEVEKSEDAPYWWMAKGSPFKRSPEVFSQPIVVAAAYANNPFLNGAKPFESQAAQPNDLFGAGGNGAKAYAAPGYLPPDLPKPAPVLRCTGQSVCVPANNCLSGSIDKSQVISFNQNCNPGNEVCCAVRTPPPPPPPPVIITTTYAPRPTQPQSIPCLGPNRGCVPPNLCNNGYIKLGAIDEGRLSQQCYAPEVCCRIPENIPQPNEHVPNREYIPAPVPSPTTIRPYVRPVVVTTPRPIVTRPPFAGVSYIPPQLPSESNNNEVVRPPAINENELAEPIIPTRPRQPFQPAPVELPIGCPAAMNCTEEQYCAADGSISTTPIQLSESQQANRVPLTDCRDLVTGITGKCCRDPNYTDPWPTGRLGQYVPNELNAVFDDGQYRPPQGRQAAPPAPRAQQQNQIRPIGRRPTPIGNPIISGEADKSPAIVPQFGRNADYQPIAQGSCITRHINAAPRGNGPIDAGFGEFPWQAMILKESTKSLLCGGAIIENNVVATSANCVDGQRANDVLIKAGEWQLGVDDAKPFQLMRVKSISFHPAYQPTNLEYDIALLHLENPLKFDSHIGPICIDDHEPAASETCVTTGWGKEVLKVHAQDALPHAVPIQPVPQGQCQASLNGFNPTCSVCGTPKADACEADVGSALACEKGNGQYYLKGIYSTENGCGNPNQLITFTKPDTEWMKQAMRNPGQQLGEYVPAPNTPQFVKTPVPSVGNGYLPPQ